MEPSAVRDSLTLDTSDEICAEYIVDRLGGASGDAVAVLDYLQLLDQRRRNPELAVQVGELKAFVGSAGATIVTISQIDRSFNASEKGFPEMSDVRLPNPLDLLLFTKTCFMHAGEIQLKPAV